MRIKIIVVGGLVQEVQSEQPSQTWVQVYDEDNIKAGDEPPVGFDFPVEKLEERESKQ